MRGHHVIHAWAALCTAGCCTCCQNRVSLQGGAQRRGPGGCAWTGRPWRPLPQRYSALQPHRPHQPQIHSLTCFIAASDFDWEGESFAGLLLLQNCCYMLAGGYQNSATASHTVLLAASEGPRGLPGTIPSGAGRKQASEKQLRVVHVPWHDLRTRRCLTWTPSTLMPGS